jgi:hypothetical protein
MFMWAVEISSVHYRLDLGMVSRYGVESSAVHLMMSCRSIAQVSRFIGEGLDRYYSYWVCIVAEEFLMMVVNVSESIFHQLRHGLWGVTSTSGCRDITWNQMTS